MTNQAISFIERLGLRKIDSNIREMNETYKEAIPFQVEVNISQDKWIYSKRFLELTNIADEERDFAMMSEQEISEYVQLEDYRLNGTDDTQLNARMIQYKDQLAEYVAGL